MRIERRAMFVAAAALFVSALYTGEARAQSAGAGAKTPPGPRLRFVENPSGIDGVNLTVYFHAPPEAVWEVVTNPVKAASLFDRMTAIKRSARGPNFREYHLNSFLGEKLVICAIQQDDARRSITWKRVDGHLHDMSGYYKVRSSKRYPGYSRMDYASFIDPGAIGRAFMTNRSKQRDVMAMIARIRRFVEHG